MACYFSIGLHTHYSTPNAIVVGNLVSPCIANEVRNNVAQTLSHVYDDLKYKNDI
jgi:hypothetical protein